DEEADDVSGSGAREPDGGEHRSAPAARSGRQPCLQEPEREEAEPAEHDRRDGPRHDRARSERERKHRDGPTDERRSPYDEGGSAAGGSVDGLEAVLLAHHDGDPDVAVRADRVDDAVEQLAAKALLGVDASDLVAFDRRGRLDMAELALPLGAE